MISSSRDRPQIDTLVVFWILALFAITALGVLPLFFYRLDLSKLTFSTPIPVLVGIGIEITAYAPTLAALLVIAAWASATVRGPNSDLARHARAGPIVGPALANGDQSDLQI